MGSGRGEGRSLYALILLLKKRHKKNLVWSVFLLSTCVYGLWERKNVPILWETSHAALPSPNPSLPRWMWAFTCQLDHFYCAGAPPACCTRWHRGGRRLDLFTCLRPITLPFPVLLGASLLACGTLSQL